MTVLQVERANEPLPDYQQEWDAIEHQYFGDNVNSMQTAVDTAIELNHWFTFKGCDHTFRARVVRWIEHPDGTFTQEVLL